MPSEADWEIVQRQLVTDTEDGKVNWSPNSTVNRSDSTGDIYIAHVAGKMMIVYEYRYPDFQTGEPTTDVAIEFIEPDGKSLWKWPQLAYRVQLLDAIRYRLSGAVDFLNALLPTAKQSQTKPPVKKIF